MLDYCGLTEESKDVYKVMDEILSAARQHLDLAESVRPTRTSSSLKGPRPGAVWTQLPLLFFKARNRPARRSPRRKR